MIKVNRKEVKIEIFPNGEIKMPKVVEEISFERDSKLAKENEKRIYLNDSLRFSNLFELIYENETDLIVLMFLKNWYDKSPYKPIRTMLRIPYLPYSRMDRVHSYSEFFTLKYICDFINNLNFSSVEVYEPHSDVCMALLNNVIKIDYTKILFDEIFEKGEKAFSEIVKRGKDIWNFGERLKDCSWHLYKSSTCYGMDFIFNLGNILCEDLNCKIYKFEDVIFD